MVSAAMGPTLRGLIPAVSAPSVNGDRTCNAFIVVDKALPETRD